MSRFRVSFSLRSWREKREHGSAGMGLAVALSPARRGPQQRARPGPRPPGCVHLPEGEGRWWPPGASPQRATSSAHGVWAQPSDRQLTALRGRRPLRPTAHSRGRPRSPPCSADGDSSHRGTVGLTTLCCFCRVSKCSTRPSSATSNGVWPCREDGMTVRPGQGALWCAPHTSPPAAVASPRS